MLGPHECEQILLCEGTCGQDASEGALNAYRQHLCRSARVFTSLSGWDVLATGTSLCCMHAGHVKGFSGVVCQQAAPMRSAWAGQHHKMTWASQCTARLCCVLPGPMLAGGLAAAMIYVLHAVRQYHCTSMICQHAVRPWSV